MKALLILYGFPPHAIGGACIYHGELAKQLHGAGFEVIVCSKSCAEAYQWEGIQVIPFRFYPELIQPGVSVITVPSISAALPTDCRPVCIQHTVQKVAHPHPHARFIYCAEHLQGMYNGNSMVYRPTMRLTEGKKGNLPKRPTIGFINNAIQKGGNYIEPIAIAFDGFRIKVVDHPERIGFIRPDLQNIEYVGWKMDEAFMNEFYSDVDIMVLPSFNEAYSTVALECLGKGIPVVARPIVGHVEVLGEAAMYAEGVSEFIDGLWAVFSCYQAWGDRIVHRWKEVKGLNSLTELINFVL